MKNITKLATLCMALLLSLGLGVMTACDNTPAESSSPAASSETSSNSTPSTDAATAYSIQLIDESGAPLSGYAIQLCKGTTACYNPCFTDANGMVSYSFPKINKVPTPDAYDIHVWDADMTQEYTYSGDHTTPAEYDGTTIVLTLGEAK